MIVLSFWYDFTEAKRRFIPVHILLLGEEDIVVEEEERKEEGKGVFVLTRKEHE